MSDDQSRKRKAGTRSGGHAGNRARSRAAVIDQMPWRIPVNPDRPVEPLDAEGVQRIIEFRQMVQAGLLAPGRPFVVLAACTEVPEIVRTLKVGGSPEMRALLAQASVADPMGITQAHVARLDAGTPLGSGL
mgnify:CR=1 FL=1